MSRKLSLLPVCCLLLMFGATSLVAETPAPADSKTEVSSATRCGRCGDGQCVKSCGETAQSCPADCGGVPVPSMATTQPATPACGSCGDGWCVAMCGETAENCPTDCGKIKPVDAQAAACQAENKPAKKE